ncbi:dipeptidase 1-like isoform X1 [Daktulosphaira vitifoliae]|uniref:dipeptidase 1-like isoform X1 n=1 Tax=Daktulosphaira vitifoliae TaxID=58002 RepID=UPI0021A9BE51|nr:dipeptidase 1-like isoform X1 [Daktulosphaira vitifoliae]
MVEQLLQERCGRQLSTCVRMNTRLAGVEFEFNYGKRQNSKKSVDQRERSHVAGIFDREPNVDLDLDLKYHLQTCTCSCNHMGFGNYMDYYQTEYSDMQQTSRPSSSANIRRDSLCNGQIHNRREYESPNGSINSDRSRKRTVYEIQVRPCAGILFVIVGVVILLVWIAMPNSSEVPGVLTSHQEETLEVIRRILKEVPLIDGHNDLPWNIRKFVHNQLMYFNFSTDLKTVEPWSRSNWSQTDIPRLKKGLVGAQFWSAYVPCGRQHLDVVQTTMEQIDVIRRLAENYSNDLQLVTSVKGIREAHKAKKIASLIGVEGGHSLGNSLAVLRTFHSLGARYLTLTHTCDTSWAGCCSGLESPENKHHGLSPFGLLVLRELNRLGMMVDLSHTSVRTMEDALNHTLAPVIFSHSCAYALCTSLRNVPDHVLKLVALNDGIVMVSFYSYFISCNSTSTMEQVIAHINHIKNVAGEDHVGLGAGYDGINHTTQGLEDVSHYPLLLASLMANHSWTEDQVKKLAGNNLLRVFSKVEKVRDEWKEDGMKPMEDILLPLNKEPLLPNCTDGYNTT